MITFQKYVKAQTLEEAYTLNQVKNNKIIGGMLWLRLSTANYNTVIDLSDLGLDKIEETDSEFKIGAMVTLRDLEMHESLNQYTDCAIRTALKDIIGVQFRNLATVGGSIWGRFGFSDVLTVLLPLDAYVELYKGGILPLQEFSKMQYDNDILTHIIIKKSACKCIYDSVRIQRTDFPVLTFAASCMGDEVRIAVGARPDKAVLFCDTAQLVKNRFSPEAVAALADELSAAISTGSNNRGSAAYRTKLISGLAKRNLAKLGE